MHNDYFGLFKLHFLLVNIKLHILFVQLENNEFVGIYFISLSVTALCTVHLTAARFPVLLACALCVRYLF